MKSFLEDFDLIQKDVVKFEEQKKEFLNFINYRLEEFKESFLNQYNLKEGDVIEYFDEFKNQKSFGFFKNLNFDLISKDFKIVEIFDKETKFIKLKNLILRVY